jgi:alkaline phosphatase D
MMGMAQEQWLYKALKDSVHQGARWQVLLQQVVMGPLLMPELNASWLSPSLPATSRGYLQLGLQAAKMGLPFSFDRWDGFPAARERLLQAAQQADANAVVLSGDSHNAWGYDLSSQGKPVGVEFAGHSVTSPGYEGIAAPGSHDAFAKAARDANPSMRFCDTHRRGYMSVQLSPQVVLGNWHFMQTVAERNPTVAESHSMVVQHGRRRLQDV